MEPEPEAGPAPHDDARHIACSMTSVLLHTVRAANGEAGVRQLLETAGTPHDAAFLECTDNWISIDEAVALLEAGIEVTGDPRLARRVGEGAVRQHAGTQVATLLRSLGSPEAVLNGITVTAAKFSTVTEMEAIESEPGRAVVRAAGRNGLQRPRLLCDWTTGLLSQPCVLFGLPPARVEETECQARGGKECRYTITWDKELAAEAADPEQRVRALEAQVVAMSQRLESAYATASDLVSADDLETVLARIVERAATAVRAPAYVLAVRPEPGGEMRVFSDGIEASEAARIGAVALDGSEPDDSMLCVDVASSRRDYGRLIALHPAGMRFFTQEEQLLALYAKHAAAVLDMAMALREASRRHDNVSRLLALSEALARGGSTEEVAQALAEAVVDVIDCDRATMWIWDEQDGTLLRRGAVGAVQSDPPTIGFRDTPYLSRMVNDPQPMFFCDDVDDDFLESIMTDSRLVALAVVPIIAREVFLGLLAVGVESDPGRLRSTPDLLEKLTGVAALAAPALQNGRLIDELGWQVIHDSLTGVLNRAGFSQAIEAVLGREAGVRGLGGILFVDLDGFKQLNDEYGHYFGDGLLRAAAARLRETVRGGDMVGRLGGDEFALILPRLTTPAELDSAAGRVNDAFAEPFEIEGRAVELSASVGGAMFPDHGTTIDELLRHADGQMYREKARRRAAASVS